VAHPILIAGTGSWQNDGSVDWYCPTHPFGKFLTDNNLSPSYDNNSPFIWSTNTAGIPVFTNKKDWAAGGAALSYFVKSNKQMAGCDTSIIAHSHALQVVAYAAADHDLKIDALITMGSPIREDLKPQYDALRKNTRYWLHVHSDGSDKWQWLGELFDKANPFTWRVERTTPLADKNDFVPKVGHSTLLRDPSTYHYWLEHKWLDAFSKGPKE
jgi:hypothetical protein